MPRVRSVRRRMKGRVACKQFVADRRSSTLSMAMALGEDAAPIIYMKPGVVGPVLFPGLGKSGNWKGRAGEGVPPSRANGENDTAMCGALVAYTSYRLHYGPNHAELIAFAAPVTEKLCRPCYYRATNILVWMGGTVRTDHPPAAAVSNVRRRKNRVKADPFLFERSCGIPFTRMHENVQRSVPEGKLQILSFRQQKAYQLIPW
jgi:hypothetical protein